MARTRARSSRIFQARTATPFGRFSSRRSRICGLIWAASALAQNFAAPPWVKPGSVVNAASKLPALLPGGALAPGALISIDGIRFNPADVSIEVEIDAKSYKATVVSATEEHIMARMPDFRQSGHGKLFVISHGQRSSGSEITLSTSAFGIFTVNGEGWGPAGSLQEPGGVTASLPLMRPGQETTISGTGFGDGPVQVLVGDLMVSSLRRSSKKGLDQITFRIPQQSPIGCAVPIIATSGMRMSNTATLQISGGRSCESNRNWFDDLRAPGRRSANLALLHSDVILELAPGKPVHFSLDNFAGGFAHHLGNKPSGPFDLLPAAGSCINWAGPLDSNQLAIPSIMGASLTDPDIGPDLGPDIANRASGVEDLDAGPEVAVTGPQGMRKALRARNKPRIYAAVLGGNPPLSRIPPTPLFLAPGSYRIQSEGGADIGPVNVALDVGEVIEWRNRDAIQVVDRRTGVDLEWKLPPGYTAVTFAWNISRRNSFGGFAVCLPTIQAEHYHLPADFLTNLPPTTVSASDLSLGFVGVAAVPLDPPSFETRGIERGRVLFASMSGRSVIVK